ncbi:MAG: TolC family protein [Arcicella sp.]|nr:TolC family protein [Arcicella sp.]
MKTLLVLIGSCMLLSQVMYAQKADTLKLSLSDAEQQFSQKNFLLLAQKYGIEASKAAIIQAGLLPNPTVSLEQTVISQPTIANDAPIGPFGQRAFQIQQLIQVAGKRNKQINLAKTGVEISQYQFLELVRGLLFQLRSSFYQIHYLQKTLLMYNQEIQKITGLVNAYQDQVQKGNIPQKELIRLQSFLITLEGEASEIINQITDNQTTIKVLLADKTITIIEPLVDDTEIENMNLSGLVLADLIGIAIQSRSDLKVQEATTQYSIANFNLQKALAKPDITVGYSYDRSGSYVNDYHALTLSMALPFFNRNQGNIKIAENQVDANRQYFSQTQIQLENEILQAYTKAKEDDRLFRKIDKKFQTNFEKLILGVLENYQKRNLTLIEFTDFLESYKNTVSQLNRVQNNRIQAFENLNFVVGKKVL